MPSWSQEISSSYHILDLSSSVLLYSFNKHLLNIHPVSNIVLDQQKVTLFAPQETYIPVRKAVNKQTNKYVIYVHVGNLHIVNFTELLQINFNIFGVGGPMSCHSPSISCPPTYSVLSALFGGFSSWHLTDEEEAGHGVKHPDVDCGAAEWF